MPTIEQNLEAWERTQDWSNEGNEWSQTWGGPEPQWFASIYPRIHSFLPTGTILEIAPGFGRWTQFLKGHCQNLTVVDLTAACIEGCQKRFQAESHITYHVNDGKSLAMIPDGSIDFVFSFDSLVHVEADVIEAYVKQLGTKLSTNGTGFIHHSNLGSFVNSETKQLPFENPHWRAESMAASMFVEFCEAANLKSINQELVNWGQDDEDRLTDCISVFTRKGSTWDRENVLISNGKFMAEARYINRMSAGYIFHSSK